MPQRASWPVGPARRCAPAGGRWFVYLQLRDGPGRNLETLLELAAGAAGARATKALYVATPPAATGGQVLFGGALYLVVLGLLAGRVRLATGVRRAATPRRYGP